MLCKTRNLHTRTHTAHTSRDESRLHIRVLVPQDALRECLHDPDARSAQQKVKSTLC